ncbi:hypothetical protein GUITHDRAFT_106723 [Guillardia theta CCMP2712]|uniref:Uncharacterized protein n=1 Tax=Guillardia theta (strain CCMP2712) TaxID=905079 RepID=L1JFI9_GUITC|nr:hypothetical protein GUITHDRAFT_106723 [Guillardia theta CCMP2712]EKX47273.1 hypothetical protein GUITHDRAFT_106723 [Guillardia theta CCMP2712]|eukprot:XP_005834253.1 hypothetical protein GUITHDRAFT_106723 [Guillardia theta CCMP2712]
MKEVCDAQEGGSGRPRVSRLLEKRREKNQILPKSLLILRSPESSAPVSHLLTPRTSPEAEEGGDDVLTPLACDKYLQQRARRERAKKEVLHKTICIRQQQRDSNAPMLLTKPQKATNITNTSLSSFLTSSSVAATTRSPSKPDKAAEGMVSSSKAAEGMVSSSKAAEGMVSSSKAAEGMVSSSKAAEGMVSSSKAAEGMVSSSKAAEGMVSSSKAAEGMVSSNKEQVLGSDKVKADGDVKTKTRLLLLSSETNELNMCQPQLKIRQSEGLQPIQTFSSWKPLPPPPTSSSSCS